VVIIIIGRFKTLLNKKCHENTNCEHLRFVFTLETGHG
jgi:hypothetical protein